jgi:hypothetical protein
VSDGEGEWLKELAPTPQTTDPLIRLMALEIAADRLAAGFMRCLQTDNKCVATGRACHDKCGCREELKEWCKQ